MHLRNLDINWLGHSGFRLTDKIYNRTICIDPFKILGGSSADIILITHEHFDHCSIEDLKKISTPKTTIIAPADCISKFQGKVNYKNIKILKPKTHISLGNIEIEAIPSYNINKTFHPEENEWVGYIISMNSKRIYHAGDSDRIPEMSSLKNIDVAFMPVSGTYVMDAKEAANAVSSFQPKIAIPMHYDSIVGDKNDAEEFKNLCPKDTEVIILKKNNI